MPDTEPLEATIGAEQTFPEEVKGQIGAGLCPKLAEVMEIILTFFQKRRTNVGTRVQKKA